MWKMSDSGYTRYIMWRQLKEHIYAVPPSPRSLEDLVAIDAITLRRVQVTAMQLNAV
jgi:hypothetical protein